MKRIGNIGSIISKGSAGITKTRSFNFNEIDLTLESAQSDRIVSGDQSTTRDDVDVRYQTYTTATIAHEAIIKVDGSNLNDLIIENATPSIASLSGTSLTYIKPGTSVVIARNHNIQKAIKNSISLEEGTTNQEAFLEFVEGYLSRSCADQIDQRIADTTPETDKLIYSSQWVRNTNCWVYGLKGLTSISPYNNGSISYCGGTLITPRHMLFCKHWGLSMVGKTILFVDSNNVQHSAVVQSQLDVDSVDWQVWLLDRAIPNDITPIRIMPIELLMEYAPGYAYGIPVFFTDQNRWALITEFYNYSSPPLVPQSNYKIPTLESRLAYYKDVIVGDSGKPICIILETINGSEMFLFSTWHGTARGPATDEDSLDKLMIAINEIGNSWGYELDLLEESELSSFSMP
jgi:hypothetical protein